MRHLLMSFKSRLLLSHLCHFHSYKSTYSSSRATAVVSPASICWRSFHGSVIMSEPEKKILTEEELERKKKKEEKAKEKELKKLKALEKAEKMKEQQKQEQGASKKSAKRNVKRDDGEENPDDFVDPETPLGDRKKMSKQMAKQYNPTAVEKS